jgi:hypothetical protein
MFGLVVFRNWTVTLPSELMSMVEFDTYFGLISAGTAVGPNAFWMSGTIPNQIV